MGENTGNDNTKSGGKEIIPVMVAAFAGALVGAIVGSQMGG